MTDQPRSKIIEENPIGQGVDAFRVSFNSVCADRTISHVPDALDQLDHETLRNLIRAFLRAAQNLPAADLLPATTYRGTLRDDLLRLELSLRSDDLDLDRIKPLLNAALTDHLNDALIWDRVYDAVTESTPPPRPIASSLQQTPWLRNTSNFANSSEHREYVDNVLKEELGPMYVGLKMLVSDHFATHDPSKMRGRSSTCGLWGWLIHIVGLPTRQGVWLSPWLWRDATLGGGTGTQGRDFQRAGRASTLQRDITIQSIKPNGMQVTNPTTSN